LSLGVGSSTISNMNYMGQPLPRQKTSGGLIAAIVVLVLLLLAAGVFGAWSFGERQDYKLNSDQKVQAAVQANTEKVKAEERKIFDQEEKSPLRTYIGPQAYGSVRVVFPKTWSVYVDSTGDNSPDPLDVYMNPGFVESVDKEDSRYALRVKVESSSYSQTLSQLKGSVQQKKATVSPYSLPKTPSVSGSIVSGEIGDNKKGSMVVLPIRDKVLKIWTESENTSDFTDIILPAASFSP